MSWQKFVFVVLLESLIGSQKQVHSILTHGLRTAFLRFSAEKFWPTSENGPCWKTQFWFPLHYFLSSCRLWLPIRVQFWCSLESNLSGQMNFHLLAKCTHDKPLNLRIVKIIQCLSSWNTVRLQLWSGILHQYKICSLCPVVITFQIVLYIFAVDPLIVVQDHRSKVCVSSSHLARTMG